MKIYDFSTRQEHTLFNAHFFWGLGGLPPGEGVAEDTTRG